MTPTPELQGLMTAMGTTLAETVRKYFRDSGHREEFEAWYLKRYGRPYEWRKVELK